MLNLIHAPDDAKIVTRLQNDLQAALQKDTLGKVTIVILSPAANADSTVQQEIITALDAGQHLIPVIAKPVAVPKLLDHLPLFDFSQKYDIPELVERIRYLSSPEAGLPVRVRTPKVKSGNERIAFVLVILTIIMFVAAIYLVGEMGVQAPPEEYIEVHYTETALVQGIIDRYLPTTTEDALNFVSTVQAAPPSLQPLLSDQATQIAPGAGQ